MITHTLLARVDSTGAREKIWDHVAALVVTAAGGRVTDFDGAPLDFGRGRSLEANRGVLATRGAHAIHEAILDEIKQQEAGSSS